MGFLLNGLKIKKVVLILLKNGIVMNCVGGLNFIRINKFGSTEQKRQEVVVIDSPDAMAARRLQHVGQLKLAHETDVLVENAPQDQV